MVAGTREARWFWMAAGVLVVVLQALSPVTSAVRIDRSGGDYYEGFLTWKGLERGIDWTGRADTEDEVDPNPPDAAVDARAPKWKLGNTARWASGDASLMPEVLDFTSAPTTRDLEVNASRQIKLDLLIKGSPVQATRPEVCDGPRVSVELYVGTTFFSGGVPGVSDGPVHTWPAGTWPTVDDGYCIYLHRMQPELAKIPAGSVLRLRLIFALNDQPFLMNFTGEPRSRLSIPYYNDDELVFRTTAPTQRRVSVDTGDDAEASPASWMLGFGLLAAPRSRRSLILLLAATLLGSGCLEGGGSPGAPGKSPPVPKGGQIESHVIVPGNGTNPANGSILGLVHDDYRFPIPRAHVSLVKTNALTFTDASGRFALRDLAPRTYTIRVLHQDFKVLESTVIVEAGAVTRLEAQMEPLVVKEGWEAPHRHDYWAGRATKAAMSGVDVGSIQCPPEYGGMPATAFAGAMVGNVRDLYSGGSMRTACSEIAFILPPDETGRTFNTIVPGTDEVEIKVAWTGEEPRRVGLKFHDSGDWYQASNYTVLYPRASGEAFHLRTGWEMTDAGHARVTGWRFSLFVPEGDLPASAAYTTFGPFTVTMTLHRGLLPLEQGHRDLWDGQESLRAINVTRALTSPNSNYQYITTAGAIVMTYFFHWGTYGGILTMVPPEADRVELWINESQPMSVPIQWNLRVKTAAAPNDAFCNPAAGVGMPLAAGARTGTSTYWELPVRPIDTDPYYARASGWCIWVTLSESDYALFSAIQRSVEIHADMFVHRARGA